MQTDADILDDHVSLYKGKAHMDLKYWDEAIDNDGSVELSAVATFPGGDFNWDFSAQYWSPDKETAEEYRKYVARRCPTVDRLHREELWYSPNWKEFIWTCRKGRTPNEKFDYIVSWLLALTAAVDSFFHHSVTPSNVEI